MPQNDQCGTLIIVKYVCWGCGNVDILEPNVPKLEILSPTPLWRCAEIPNMSYHLQRVLRPRCEVQHVCIGDKGFRPATGPCPVCQALWV